MSEERYFILRDSTCDFVLTWLVADRNTKQWIEPCDTRIGDDIIHQEGYWEYAETATFREKADAEEYCAFKNSKKN